MKKIAFLVVVLFIFYSCKQEDMEVSTKSEAQKLSTSENAIEQAEKLVGQKLFKKEVEFKDVSGKNSVKFRFAGYDEASIDSYLNQYQISIKPLSTEDKESIKNKVSYKVKTGTQNSTNSNETIFSGIAIDFISKNLEQGYDGYLLTMTVKKTEPVKNAKTNYYACFESWMNWPELAIIQNNSLYWGAGFDFLGKSYWWTGYTYRFSDWVPPVTIGEFEYDGPWRSQVCINNVNPDVSVSWVSW